MTRFSGRSIRTFAVRRSRGARSCDEFCQWNGRLLRSSETRTDRTGMSGRRSAIWADQRSHIRYGSTYRASEYHCSGLDATFAGKASGQKAELQGDWILAAHLHERLELSRGPTSLGIYWMDR